MNPLDTSDIESLLRGVHERIKQHSQQEKKNQPKPQPVYETVNPVQKEETTNAPVLTLKMDDDGVWRVS